jgi:predicted enzyme related to lactoylglutathione lyase
MPNIDQNPPGSLCWIELGTTDQNAAKKFYPTIFGWNVNDMPMGPGEFYSTFQLQGRDTGAAYTLRKDQLDHGVPPHWMIYVAVKSADAAAKRAAELGGTVIFPAFDVFEAGRMAVLQDPTGAAFCVWEPKKNTGLGISGVEGTLCWADLSTPDQQRASRFYSSLFGWKLDAGQDDSGYLHIQNGEHHIGGIPPAQYRDPNVPPHWMIYFLVSDCDRTTEKAKQLGAKVYMPPTTMEKVGRWAILADPQGAVFAVFQQMPRS